MTTINIYDLWQLLLSEVNIQQNGQVRPEVDFTPWVNKVSDKLFRDRIATDETAQLYSDDLAPFKTRVNINVRALPGQPYDLVQYPADYEGFANMLVLRHKQTNECFCDTNAPLFESRDGKCQQVVDPDYAEMEKRMLGANLVQSTVNKVDLQYWGSAMEHPTKGPTFNNPKTTQSGTGFFIAPKGLTTVVLDYYRTPRKAIFGYTIGAGDIVVYDPGTSQQLEWSNTLQNVFMDELKKIYAQHVNDQSIYQMAKDSGGNSI